MNIGLVGGGMFGKTHVESVRQDGRGQINWVCTKTSESLEEFQNSLGILNGTLDYQDILDDPGVGAVIISTPPFNHVEIALKALHAGKHILLEKPLCVSKDEMDTLLLEVGKRPELTVLEASCRHTRLQPKFSYVKRVIDSGKLGKIYHMHHNMASQTTFLEYNPKASWALEKKLAGGGPLFDWGEYDLSFHLGLLEDRPQLKSLRKLSCHGLRESIHANVEQHAAAWLEFDTGLTYYYERGAGVHQEIKSETRIYGTRGGLRFSYLTWESNEIDYFYEDASGKPMKETLKVDMSAHPGNDNIPLISHFMDCIEGKAKPIMPLELASKHLGIILEILA